MAEVAVGFAIETLGNLLIQEAKFLAGVSDQVEDLMWDLERLRSFLQDAETRNIDQRSIQVWILHSRELAYRAEDLLEDYAFKIALQRENILKRSVCFMKECYIRRSIGSEIQTLTSKISRLTRSFQEYGIRPYKMEREGSISSSQQQLRRTSSRDVEDDFINLDNQVELLVGHLVNENNADLPEYKVVSIFGMGGLGKTTLAKRVYNHSKVKGYFDSLAWVCISQQWQKRGILEGIIIKFLPQQRKDIKEWKDEELIGKISQIWKDKRCLVVLDDIWSNQPWESIKDAFPSTEKGCKLLLTTRNRSFALDIDPNGFHHQPRLLSDPESWELLKTKAYIGDDEEKQKLGKEMVKYCEGLPLAVVVLGGILATKRDTEEWKTVHRNVRAHIVRGKQGEVEKILALSYNDLPPKLRTCFLYLGRFPEDSEIDVERLYQLWIAEGMILIEDKMSTEESMLDVAEHYLGELVERSMVQVKLNVDMEKISRFSSCHLHDLLRDLSLKKAKEENFFSSVRFGDGSDHQIYESSSSTHQIHRLVIHFKHQDDNYVHKFVPPPKIITKHLRSLGLLVEGNSWVTIISCQFSWFRMLRVLEIEHLYPPDVSDCKEFYLHVIDYLDLSKGISNLIHLRYLSVRGSLFSCLPSSLVNIKQLQTIDLRDARDLWLPNILWKMRQLKYLYLPRRDEWRNIGCHKLRLDGLNELEILEGFDSSLCSCKDLIKLKRLRSLQGKFYGIHFDIVKILDFISDSKSLLKVDLELYFFKEYSFGTPENWSAVMNKLFSCQKLTKLYIQDSIGNLPKYEAGFGLDLVHLTLLLSSIKDDPMKTLGKLPSLKSLDLGLGSFLGTEMRCCATDFPQIRKLELHGLSNLKKWIIDKGAMPNLSVLEIGNCKKLEKIPDGLKFIKTLEELQVSYMPEKFKRRLQVINDQEGEDFNKIQHVPVVEVW